MNTIAENQERDMMRAASKVAFERWRMHGWIEAVKVTRARSEQYRPGAFQRKFEERILRILRMTKIMAAMKRRPA